MQYRDNLTMNIQNISLRMDDAFNRLRSDMYYTHLNLSIDAKLAMDDFRRSPAGDMLTLTPERAFRWTGATLKAFGYVGVGKPMGWIGTAVEPAGIGKTAGMIIGGITFGAIGGSRYGIPGAIVGGIAGGYIFGNLGERFDSPYAGNLYGYDEIDYYHR